jgi:hypothetical protein
MNARLLPCTACARHIRATEPTCPFCGEALPDAYRHAGPAALPKKRLGRAARFAFGAVVAGTLAATGCGDDDGTSDTGTPDTSTTLDSGTPDTSAGDTGTADTGSADSAADTGSDADTGVPDAVAPPYGAPPDAG